MVAIIIATAIGAERHTSMLEAKQSDTPRMIALIHSLHNCKQLFVNEQAINACLSLYAALLLGYTIHFIYCIWGNLRIIAAATAMGTAVPYS